MTDKELAQALRKVHDAYFTPGVHSHSIYGVAAIRLEALLAENERLKAQLPKWRPASEPPEEDDYYLCRVKSFLRPGRTYANILEYCNGGFREGQIYTDDVTGWMPLSSTEGVE